MDQLPEINTDALADFYANYFGSGADNPLDGPLNPGDVYTQAQLDAMEAAAREAEKLQQQMARQKQDFIDSIAGMTAGALAASHNFTELGQNLINAAGQIMRLTVTNAMPGPLGQILGGGVQFLFNMLTYREQALPVRDNAVDVRVINFSDLYLDLAAVRDRSELSFSRQRQQTWAAAARGA